MTALAYDLGMAGSSLRRVLSSCAPGAPRGNRGGRRACSGSAVTTPSARPGARSPWSPTGGARSVSDDIAIYNAQGAGRRLGQPAQGAGGLEDREDLVDGTGLERDV